MPHYPECPCCSYRLLRRVSAGRTVWFCSHCYQEMPHALLTDSLETLINHDERSISRSHHPR